MKLFALAVGCSVALNVALLASFVAKPTLAPPALREFFQRDNGAREAERQRQAAAATAAAARQAHAATVAAAAAQADFWANLGTTDLATFAARLRAAGFSPAAIRAILDAELQNRFAARYADLRRQLDETPYWRVDPLRMMGSSSKFYETYSQIGRDRMRLLREVIGKDAFAFAGQDPTEAQRRQFGNLSPGKIELVQRIADDYAEMLSQVRTSMQGVTLPEDREKIALLEREKRADLAAILTPEELADYEMRSSNITSRLRTALSILDATEAEFRLIYQAHLPHAEILYPTVSAGITFLGDTNSPRALALKKIEEDLTRSLGPDRFAQYQRASDREFQQLYQLTRADNLPYDTVVRAYDTRTTAATASMKIVEDPAMSADDKRTALKNLAQQSRTQLLSTLGPTAGPGYLDAVQWINYLEQGRGFSVMPGGSISSRSIAIPRPVTPAPKS